MEVEEEKSPLKSPLKERTNNEELDMNMLGTIGKMNTLEFSKLMYIE